MFVSKTYSRNSCAKKSFNNTILLHYMLAKDWSRYRWKHDCTIVRPQRFHSELSLLSPKNPDCMWYHDDNMIDQLAKEKKNYVGDIISLPLSDFWDVIMTSKETVPNIHIIKSDFLNIPSSIKSKSCPCDISKWTWSSHVPTPFPHKIALMMVSPGFKIRICQREFGSIFLAINTPDPLWWSEIRILKIGSRKKQYVNWIPESH